MNRHGILLYLCYNSSVQQTLSINKTQHSMEKCQQTICYSACSTIQYFQTCFTLTTPSDLLFSARKKKKKEPQAEPTLCCLTRSKCHIDKVSYFQRRSSIYLLKSLTFPPGINGNYKKKFKRVKNGLKILLRPMTQLQVQLYGVSLEDLCALTGAR